MAIPFNMTQKEYDDWVARGRRIKADADRLRAAGKTTPADGFTKLPSLPDKGDTVAIFIKKKK